MWLPIHRSQDRTRSGDFHQFLFNTDLIGCSIFSTHHHHVICLSVQFLIWKHFSPLRFAHPLFPDDICFWWLVPISVLGICDFPLSWVFHAFSYGNWIPKCCVFVCVCLFWLGFDDICAVIDVTLLYMNVGGIFYSILGLRLDEKRISRVKSLWTCGRGSDWSGGGDISMRVECAPYVRTRDTHGATHTHTPSLWPDSISEQRKCQFNMTFIVECYSLFFFLFFFLFYFVWLACLRTIACLRCYVFPCVCY